MKNPPKFYTRLLLFFAAGSLLSAGYAVGFDADKLFRTLTQRFGGASAQKFRAWQKVVADAERTEDVGQQLKKVNEFWNRRMQYFDDSLAWGQGDYWATPMESLGQEKGDCEDFAIAKYFTLISAGVDVSKLRLIYVKARLGSEAGNVTQAHMVLAYYSHPESEPEILDNLINEIRPASRRSDLAPVFSFNSQGLWAGVSASYSAHSPSASRLSRWEELLSRAHLEGFE